MKIIIKILFILLSVNIAQAQWQPDVRLTNDPAVSALSGNNSPCIAPSGNYLHVVWYDNRDGNNEIYYKRSTDKGLSWGPDTRLTNDPASSHHPSIAASGLVVHVFWQDLRNGNYDIYYKRSTDGGISWGTDTRLTNNASQSYNPSVSVSGQVVNIVWEDNRDGDYQIFYNHSSDGGISWGADTRLTSDPSNPAIPSLSISGSIVHVIWENLGSGDNYEIYYMRSTDGGISWGTSIMLSNNSVNSSLPSISVSDSAAYVFWNDNRTGNYEIYYRRSTDEGISWEPDIQLTNNPASSLGPSVSVSGSAVNVVWQENRDGNYEIYYKHSCNGGMNWDADTRLTNNPASSIAPYVVVSGSIVNVVWNDNRDGNYEIYYKRDSINCPVISVREQGNEIPKGYSLSQNYPNPFNPNTHIKFEVPFNKGGYRGLSVKLTVFDILGKEVTSLVNEQLQPGIYSVGWNASNYPSGVYYYKLTAGNFNETRKMILIK